MRSNAGQEVLPSCVSYKRKPYVDDRGERRRENGSPRDSGVSQWRNNKDDQNRDDFESRDEVETSLVP